MKQLIDPSSVERVLLLLAVAGPLVGIIIGLILGAHEKDAAPRIVAGAMIGTLGSVAYGMWRVYGAITGVLGIDSLANLGLQIAMFVALGAVLGVVVNKVSLLLKHWRS